MRRHGLAERCDRLCGHIETLTGVHTTLLDLSAKSFLRPPYHNTCALQGTCCTAYLTHLYGAYEAERWDGKYIYYCPRGLVFIATPPLQSGTPMEYCIVTGPFIMSNDAEEPFEDTLLTAEPLDGIPRLSTAQARSLSELIAAAVSSFSLEMLPPDVDSGQPAAILQMMYDLSADDAARTYPIDSERRCRSTSAQAIRKPRRSCSTSCSSISTIWRRTTSSRSRRVCASCLCL